jgi:signal transduction histidine kinase
MLRKTLTFRLVAASTIWVSVSLVAAGLLLTFLFRDHIERRFDQELYDHLEELVAASEISPADSFELTWTPSDPRFNRPQSGWYWQIARGGSDAAKSESLWQTRMGVPKPEADRPPQVQLLEGPGKERLRVLVQDITLPETDDHFTFAVAGPAEDVQADVDRFVMQLAMTLAVLGVGLLAAVLFQVRFGLRPLRAMRTALADIRSGRAERLPETYPEEVEPVVEELNALLEHNKIILQRARTQSGNLAHALKNPLTVIRNEAAKVEGTRGRLLREQLSAVTDSIDRYLSRARAAGTAGVLGARTPIKETIEDLRFSMELLHKERDLAIRVSGADGLFFRGDTHDLEEMVGNLMDNACKWARRRVLVSAQRHGDHLTVAIEDDGPGIPEERRTEVLHRGRRLDETLPGSGLGLDIARDLAELYRGSLILGTSSLGGVRAELTLPAAE